MVYVRKVNALVCQKFHQPFSLYSVAVLIVYDFGARFQLLMSFTIRMDCELNEGSLNAFYSAGQFSLAFNLLLSLKKEMFHENVMS